MHIQEQVVSLLKKSGWTREGEDFRFSKMYETGGAFGHAKMTLIMDESGRWLESVDGWGAVQKDVDLRNFPNDPCGAVKEALQGRDAV